MTEEPVIGNGQHAAAMLGRPPLRGRGPPYSSIEPHVDALSRVFDRALLASRHELYPESPCGLLLTS
jgi:hypothetical protein